MLYTVYENLQGFAKTRPPLVIFMVCLGAFAVVLLTLAYVIKVHDNLSNPDLAEVRWYKCSFFGQYCKYHVQILIIIIQLNLSITATQWRRNKWPLWAGDLYIEGPSSAGRFIYVLSYRMFPFGRHFQKDCHYSMSQFFGIVDLKLFKMV